MMAKILILLSLAVFSTSLITEGFYQFEDGQVVYIKPLSVEQKAQVLGCDLECANTCFATKTGEEAIACEKDCGCIDILGGSNQLKFWKIPFFGNVDMDDKDEKSEEEDEEGEEEEEEEEENEEEENEDEENEEEENEEEENEEEESEEEESEEEESNGREIEESINKQDQHENQNSEQEEESVPASEEESNNSENQGQEEESVDQSAESNPESSEETDVSEENNQGSSSQEEAGQSEPTEEENASESTQESEEALPIEVPSSEEASSNPDTVISEELPPRSEELPPRSEEQPVTIENEPAKGEASNEPNIDLQSGAQDSSQTLINADSSITELSSCNKECLTFCSNMKDNDTTCVSNCMNSLCGQTSLKITAPSSQGFWNISLTFLVSICIIYFIYRKLYPSKKMRRRRNHDAFYQSASDYVQI